MLAGRDAVPRLALMAVELPDAALDQTLGNARVKPIGKFRKLWSACRNHELARNTLRVTPFERGHQPAHVGQLRTLLRHRAALPAQLYQIVQVPSGYTR